MTLLDASPIIDYLRSKDPNLLAEMKQVNGTICGVTRSEILSGARSAGDRGKLVSFLDCLNQVEIPQPMWDDIGDVQSQLRAAGVTIPLTDTVLVTIALALDIEVWARDAHYKAARGVIPALKLYSEVA